MSSEVDKSVAGENDTWMLFERATADGYPLVILSRADNPLIADLLENGKITLVRCQADVSMVTEWGMPQATDRLDGVIDKLVLELKLLELGAFHIGNITGDGRRDIVFVHAEPIDFGPLLKLVKAEGYSLSAVPAADRRQVGGLLAPSDIDRQLNGDLGVISNLEKNGDNGLTPRKTEFWFFGEEVKLRNLIEELAAHGYAVERWQTGPVQVILSKIMPVDFGTFRDVTPMLVETAKKYGVQYDGWETEVINPARAASSGSPEPTGKPRSFLNKLFGAKKN